MIGHPVEHDDLGYYVECPECGVHCYGRSTPGVTTSAGWAYAEHYTTTHEPPKGKP